MSSKVRLVELSITKVKNQFCNSLFLLVIYTILYCLNFITKAKLYHYKFRFFFIKLFF